MLLISITSNSIERKSRDIRWQINESVQHVQLSRPYCESNFVLCLNVAALYLFVRLRNQYTFLCFNAQWKGNRVRVPIADMILKYFTQRKSDKSLLEDTFTFDSLNKSKKRGLQETSHWKCFPTTEFVFH